MYGATLVSKLRRGTHLYMKGYTFTWGGGVHLYIKGYTFCCGGICFYLGGGGAFLWRVYGYYYKGMYFCVRDILLLEGGTLRQRHLLWHNYFGVALGARLAITMKCTHAQWIIFARGRKL